MHWKYGKYLLRHKWFVFLSGMRLGVPLVALIVHDWSKFLPSEWLPYARFFYGPHSVAPKKTAAEQRTTVPQPLRDAFDVAWLLHQNRQPHHWQFWVILRDDGSQAALPMPDRYRREMLADWQGAGRAVGHPDTAAWYRKNHDKMQLHRKTRNWVESQLGLTECPTCGLNQDPCVCDMGQAAD